jgi:hypothetical protein
MTLTDLPKQIPSFSTLSEPDVVKLMLWWVHTYDEQVTVDTSYLRKLYEQLHRAMPREGVASILNKLADRKPPQVIRARDRYKLEQRTLEEHRQKYGNRDATIIVDKLLRDLPAKLTNLQERAYLEEALICFRAKAFRAATVMTWNLAYDHLCYWILADSSRLAKFNAQMALTYAKKGYDAVANRDGFEEPKEFEVLQVCASAGIINGGMHMILKEKLDRRNKAAHPTGTPISQLTAESLISDLIDGVVVKLV